MPSYYELLNIDKKVSKADLIVAYFSRASSAHPAHGTMPPRTIEFLQVSEAFAVLYEPKARFRYDAHLKSGSAEVFSIPIDESAALILHAEIAAQIAVNYSQEGMKPDDIFECLTQFQCPVAIANDAVSKSAALVQKREENNEFWRQARTFFFALILSLIAILTSARARGVDPVAYFFYSGLLVIVATVIYYRHGAPRLDDESLSVQKIALKQLRDIENRDQSFKRPKR